MLTHISIQNFATVDSLNLDFSTGLNVLTGETGAGKSIWVDAVTLALGNRADNNVIRENQERCDITLCFNLNDTPSAKEWLQQHQLDSNDECIIRRVINRSGPTRCTINGAPYPLQMVRELAQLLISIHGQHQHQALLKSEEQRQRLDNFAENNSLLQQIQTIYCQWQALNKELIDLQQKANNRDAELELLRYQHNELCQLNLQEDEWQQLSQQHQQLHNAKHLIGELNHAIELTVESEQVSASQLLQQAFQHLEAICAKEPQLGSAKELLNTAIIHLQEAGSELNQYRNTLNLSPEHLDNIEKRLALLHDLARKHHVEPENLIEVNKSLEQQIKELEQIDVEIEVIKKEQQLLLNKYQKLANQLTKNRQKAAQQLDKTITQNMQELGIKGGRFQVELIKQSEALSQFGNETVTFNVSTNPGQSLQPLKKIVSGGELSRISLALQVITAAKDDIATLIFDEVDVGIGGKTAAIVGKLLRQLGEQLQVLCITHLPQVAAQGHHHYQVTKSSNKQSTITYIKKLSQKEREEELTRMLGGTKITSQTRAHAKEMLENIQ